MSIGLTHVSLVDERQIDPLVDETIVDRVLDWGIDTIVEHRDRVYRVAQIHHLELAHGLMLVRFITCLPVEEELHVRG